MKIAEDLKNLAPTRTLIDLDEEDPEENKGWNKPTPRHESLYGKRADYLQQNPIDLYEHEAGAQQLIDELNKKE